MNRKIKFRVWDKLEGRFINSSTPNQGHYIITLNGEFHNLQNGSGGNDYVIQEYTGLKDENGVEIYEGDILSMPITTFDTGDIVDFIQEAVIFEGASFKWHGDFLEENLTKDLSIVGNIFENGVVY